MSIISSANLYLISYITPKTERLDYRQKAKNRSSLRFFIYFLAFFL